MKKHALLDIDTLYIGGGSPSLLLLSDLKRMVDCLQISPKESTIEANPIDLTKEKLQGYANLNFNRLSIGIQSFVDQDLKILHRTHSAQEGEDAICLASLIGFTDISIDLMYDFPYHTLKHWGKSIRTTIKHAAKITHISLYNFLFEEGSSYTKRKSHWITHVPNEKESGKMFAHALSSLQENGFQQYEISAFCKEKKQSQHNRKYWENKNVIGLGPSSFTYYNGRRSQNIPDINQWHASLLQKKLPTNFEETLPYPKNTKEALALRLRLLEGFSLNEFSPLPEDTKMSIAKLIQEKLLVQKDGLLQLSSMGKFFYDSIATEII